MSTTWYGDKPPPPRRPITVAGWARVILKGTALGVLVFGGLLVLLILRLVERPLFDPRRPITPAITVFVCQTALRLIGIELRLQGRFAPAAGAVVANHSSWLDILVLNAVKRVYFVSKADVAGWPGIGWLARATGTVFIERTRSKAAEQAKLFAERLGAGHRLLFFPEGTSSSGLDVLPFKTTLFAAFFTDELRARMQVQPVSIQYHAPAGCDARFYGWWGDMDFGPHLLAVLASRTQGSVDVVYHSPLSVADFDSRKALAAEAERAVRAGRMARPAS